MRGRWLTTGGRCTCTPPNSNPQTERGRRATGKPLEVNLQTIRPNDAPDRANRQPFSIEAQLDLLLGIHNLPLAARRIVKNIQAKIEAARDEQALFRAETAANDESGWLQ